MTDVPLETLNLKTRWPKLARIQEEVADLEARHRKASAKAATLRAGLPGARERDLRLAAEAVRSGRKAPAASHEDAGRAKLEAAEREAAVLQRALQAAQADYGALVAEHRDGLYRGVAEARRKIAARIAESARAALADYAKHEDFAYTLKGLAPPPPSLEDQPVQRLTQVVGGAVMTTRSAGPPRGEVEGLLAYLIGLEEPASAEEGEASGAA